MRRKGTGQFLDNSSDVLEIGSNEANAFSSENARPMRSIFPTLADKGETRRSPRLRQRAILVEKHSVGCPQKLGPPFEFQIIYPGTGDVTRIVGTLEELSHRSRSESDELSSGRESSRTS